MTTPEHERLHEVHDDHSGWRRWGPYVSERSWATVREDYSADGDAWDYLPHDLARSKAYRWGEDGIAGICDRYQLLCFAPVFWNERDPILKERLFGLTAHEGNHGEDVKEYYFHLDNTPTHSYMKYLYKYPQAEFPYAQLVEENHRRDGEGFEFELLDTGVFDEDRYFDIVIEYAKATPEDYCIRIEAFNRGPEAAPLHLLPHLWFRNIWARGPNAWTLHLTPEPSIHPGPTGPGFVSLVTDDSAVETLTNIPVSYRLGPRILYAAAGRPLALHLQRDQRPARLRPRQPQPPALRQGRLSPPRHPRRGLRQPGTGRHQSRSALSFSVRTRGRFGRAAPAPDRQPGPARPAGERRRRRRPAQGRGRRLLRRHPSAWRQRRRSARSSAAPSPACCGASRVTSSTSTSGSTATPACRRRRTSRLTIRNQHWRHLNSMRVLVMPDKWEYPWFAAWDLAFQCVPLALVDRRLRQGAAVLAAVRAVPAPQRPTPRLRMGVFRPQSSGTCLGGLARLQHGPHPHRHGPTASSSNAASTSCSSTSPGGSTRSIARATTSSRAASSAWTTSRSLTAALRCGDGGVLEQSDATGYMGMFCLNLMRIALELANDNPVYEAMAVKFFEHYAYVADAMKHMGNRGYQLWDETDGFLLRRAALSRRPFSQVPPAFAGRPDSAVRRRAAGSIVDQAVPGVQRRLPLVPAQPPATWCATSSTRSATAIRRPTS